MNRWSNNLYSQDGSQVSKESRGVAIRDPRKLHPAANHPRNHPRVTRRGSQTKVGMGGKAENGVVYMWVLNVVHMTEPTLKSFMVRRGIQVTSVEEVWNKGAAGYKSFLVGVNEGDTRKLLQRKFWPGLVVCRPWEEFDQRRGSILGRRSARPSRHHPTTTAPGVGGGQGKARPSSPHRLLGVRETQRKVALVACSAHGKDSKVKDQMGSDNGGDNSDRVRKTTLREGENKKSDTSIHKKKSTKDRKPGSRKNSLTDKHDRITRGKGGRNSDMNKANEKSTGKANSKGQVTEKEGKQQQGAKKIQPKQAWLAPQEKKSTDIIISRKTKYRQNDKYDPRETKRRPITKTKVELTKIQRDLEKYEREEIVVPSRSDNSPEKSHKRRHGYGNEDTENPVPLAKAGIRTSSNKKYLNENRTSKTKYKQAPQSSANVGKSYPNWSLSLSGLLILSSEEVVSKLLGTEYDGLLAQDDISDDELFLGVKVLAHGARSRSDPKDLQRLVDKILQPHIISLIKSFAVTVERHYPERAERYFWDLAEFLDLYLMYDSHIEGMDRLITASMSEVLALSYRHYVSADLVKVYKGMQSRHSR